MPNVNPGVLDGVRRIGAKVRDLIVDGGLPGAPLGFRLRGATTLGPPQSGTWRAGDVVHDRAGSTWTCTTAGTGPAALWKNAAGQVTVAQFLAQPSAVIAHRGLSQVCLENTLVTFRAAVEAMASQGLIPAIKTDCYLLADGSLGIMHDATVDRTTTSTGAVTRYTAQSWRTLIANTALAGPAWNSDGWGMPSLSDLLSDLGGRCVIFIEPKNGNAASVNAVIAEITARGLASSCVLVGQDATLTLPALAKAAGIGWWWYYLTPVTVASPTPQAVLAAPGVTGIGIQVNQGNSYTDADITTVVTAARAAGVPAHGYVYYRRYDYARGQSFGIGVHYVNDLAVLGSAAMLTSDLWAIGAPVPGEAGTIIPATASVSYPSYSYSGGTANYQRRIDGSVNGSGAGEACTFVSPAANSGSGKAYTVTVTVFFEATETQSSDGGRFAWVAIGFPDDRLFSANPQAAGYNILLRQGGGSTFANPTFQIMKQVPGAYNGDGTYTAGTSTQQGGNLASTTGYAAPNTLSGPVASGAAVTSVTLGSAVTIPAGIKIKFANGQIATVAAPVTASATVTVNSFTAASAIASGSAVYFGIPCSFKLDATVGGQTTLTVKRTDTSDTLTTTDTATGGTGPYNGGYIHIGKTGTGAGSTLAVSFASLTVA